jgi:hypothetical protein
MGQRAHSIRLPERDRATVKRWFRRTRLKKRSLNRWTVVRRSRPSAAHSRKYKPSKPTRLERVPLQNKVVLLPKTKARFLTTEDGRFATVDLGRYTAEFPRVSSDSPLTPIEVYLL